MTQECGITAGPIVRAGRLIAIEQEICQIRAGRGCCLLPRLELHMGGGAQQLAASASQPGGGSCLRKRLTEGKASCERSGQGPLLGSWDAGRAPCFAGSQLFGKINSVLH